MTRNSFRIILAAAALWAASSLPAFAQTSPSWTYGYVPTQAQWNALFASKQDYLGSAPLLVTGGAMTGPLVTTAPTTSSTGLNLTPGTSPASPNNGDLWVTAAGIFARVNGATYNLVSSSSTCPTCALTNAANVFTLAQTINLNATTLPAGDAGTVLQLGNANATVTRLEVTAIAAAATVTGRRGDNTLASPSALSPGDLIATFNAHGYDGTSWSGLVAGAFRVYADGPWSSTSHPTEGCISTTPLSSTTIADAFCVHQDGGATIGTATGGNKGIGTLNAAGLIYNNGTAPTGSGGGYVLATSPTIAGTPLLTGLASGTCVNGLALDSGNHIVLDTCPGAASAIQIASTSVTSAGGTNRLLTEGTVSGGTGTLADTPATADSSGNLASVASLAGSVIATKAQQQAASSSSNVVTPSQQQSHPSAAKASVNFVGTSGAINEAYNVSGVTRNSTGNYTVTFGTPFANTNYRCHTTTVSNSGAVNSNMVSQSTGSAVVQSFTTAGAAGDPTAFMLTCFGTQ